MTPPTLGPDWLDPNYLFETYGAGFFWLSLGIVFVECGLFFPVLPGDSLLFAIGLFISAGKPHLPSLTVALPALSAVAFLGNVCGYEIGRAMGPALYKRTGRVLKQNYFDQTHAFFEKHGMKALVIGRFVPIVRTFITLVAGVSAMNRRTFFVWSAIGAVLWVLSITLAGYFLGAAFPAIGKNLELAVIVIIGVSLLPMVIEWWRHRRQGTGGTKGTEGASEL